MRIFAAIAALGLAAQAESSAFAQAPELEAFSTDGVEYGAVETPLGTVLVRQEGEWGGSGRSSLWLLDAGEADGWRALDAPIASAFDDSDPAYDRAADRLCWVSTRPQDGASDAGDPDIWCARREDGEWADAVRLPEPVNSQAREYSPSFASDGSLYFASDRDGGLGQGDIYVATPLDAEGAWRVENVGPQINSALGEWNVGVSPDGDTLIVEASSRVSNRGNPGDLFFSRLINDAWTPAIPLSRLNSDQSDLMARWVDDGAVTFTSARPGDGGADIYRAAQEDFMPIEPVLAAVARSSGEVVLLDPTTLEERGRLAAGEGPHEISASQDGRVAVVPLLGIYPRPHAEPVTRRPPFLSRESEGLVILDLVSGAREALALNDCERPHGAAADAQARRVWVTCEAERAVIELDSDNWSVTRRFETGTDIHKLVLHPNGEALIGASPDSGVLHRISLTGGEVESFEAGAGAEGLSVTSDGLAAIVANGGDGRFCRIDLESFTQTWCAHAGGRFPIAVALIESRSEIWISRLADSDIGVFSLEDGSEIGSFELESGALNLAVNARDGVVYAALPRRNAVIAIDAETREIVARAENVMEVDDLDLIPDIAFGAPPDP